MGYDLTPYPKLNGPYEKIIVKSYFAPWKEDTEFINTFGIIQPYTMVDKHRCYDLWSLVRQSAKISGSLIDIGVWRGGTGGIIAKIAHRLSISDSVFLCDTFKVVVKASEKDELRNVRFLQGIFLDQTAHQIDSSAFRFCHVDVYRSAKDIIDWI